MSELSEKRLEIALKIFGWKKATLKDIACELKITELELLTYSDEEFIDTLLYFKDSIGVLS